MRFMTETHDGLPISQASAANAEQAEDPQGIGLLLTFSGIIECHQAEPSGQLQDPGWPVQRCRSSHTTCLQAL